MVNLMSSLVAYWVRKQSFPLAALHMLPARASQDTLCQVRAARFLYECILTTPNQQSQFSGQAQCNFQYCYCTTSGHKLETGNRL